MKQNPARTLRLNITFLLRKQPSTLMILLSEAQTSQKKKSKNKHIFERKRSFKPAGKNKPTSLQTSDAALEEAAILQCENTL